jgi:hypothetical protein
VAFVNFVDLTRAARDQVREIELMSNAKGVSPGTGTGRGVTER